MIRKNFHMMHSSPSGSSNHQRPAGSGKGTTGLNRPVERAVRLDGEQELYREAARRRLRNITHTPGSVASRSRLDYTPESAELSDFNLPVGKRVDSRLFAQRESEKSLAGSDRDVLFAIDRIGHGTRFHLAAQAGAPQLGTGLGVERVKI